MADLSGLHIDTDWKKQAQEEKRRLAEEQEKKKQAAASAPQVVAPGAGAGPSLGGVGAGPGARGAAGALPVASFATLVQSVVTQVLFYLGELSVKGQERSINLDMAKHNIDILGILEDKTKGNVSAEEKAILDSALYETRMRYVSVASQFII